MHSDLSLFPVSESCSGSVHGGYVGGSSISTASGSSSSVSEPRNSIIGLRDKLMTNARHDRPWRNEDSQKPFFVQDVDVQSILSRYRSTPTQTEGICTCNQGSISSSQTSANFASERHSLGGLQQRKQSQDLGHAAKQHSDAEAATGPREARSGSVSQERFETGMGATRSWTEHDEIAQADAIMYLKMLGTHANDPVTKQISQLKEEEVRSLRIARDSQCQRAQLLEEQMRGLCAHIAALEAQMDDERKVSDAALRRVDTLERELAKYKNTETPKDSSATSQNFQLTPEQVLVHDLKVKQQYLQEQESLLASENARIANLAAKIVSARP